MPRCAPRDLSCVLCPSQQNAGSFKSTEQRCGPRLSRPLALNTLAHLFAALLLAAPLGLQALAQAGRLAVGLFDLRGTVQALADLRLRTERVATGLNIGRWNEEGEVASGSCQRRLRIAATSTAKRTFLQPFFFLLQRAVSPWLAHCALHCFFGTCSGQSKHSQTCGETSEASRRSKQEQGAAI